MRAKNKILDIKKLKKLRNKFIKKKIVLCHGVFDLLHVGHINYFKSAKKYGSILIVSITNDKFVNKGPGRPAFSINNRLKFLQEIECIDFLYISNDYTAEKVIKNLRPNFYCKGNDYADYQKRSDKNLNSEINSSASLVPVIGTHSSFPLYLIFLPKDEKTPYLELFTDLDPK